MEGVILDDPAVCMCECGGEELFAGRAGQVVIFFFDHGRGEFYPFEVVVQCAADVADERAEPGFVRADAGQPHAEPRRVHFYQLSGGDEP